MPDAFVGRQPIFDPKLDVVAYELMFRGGGYAEEAPSADLAREAATVVLNALTELDLKRIVRRQPAWVKISREFLLEGLAKAIPPHLVGLEIPEAELIDDAVVSAVKELRAGGYRLALADCQGRPGADGMLEQVDLIKLDLAELGRDGIRQQVRRLARFEGDLVAEKVATRSDYDFCADAGCDLFQGYFFCQPAVVGIRGITANRLSLLRVVAALQDPNAELDDVEQLIGRDVTLSFRLMRYVNSAFFGLRGEVRSIGQALALLGLDNVRRWSTLSLLASIDDKPPELILTALIRARFCELVGAELELGTSSELFTLGLFSVVDAMMDASMHDVVETLPFAEDMREALVFRRGERGKLLDCVSSLELGDYPDAVSIVPRPGALYREALEWGSTAAEALQAGSPATGGPASEQTDPPPGPHATGVRAAASKPPPARRRPGISSAALRDAANPPRPIAVATERRVRRGLLGWWRARRAARPAGRH